MNLSKAKGDETLPYLNATCDLLYSLGVTANYKGFLHTTYAVSLCMERQDRLLLVTKWLYPDVARRYGTNWKAVERNIRTVSRIAWIRNRVLLESLARGNPKFCVTAKSGANREKFIMGGRRVKRLPPC